MSLLTDIKAISKEIFYDASLGIVENITLTREGYDPVVDIRAIYATIRNDDEIGNYIYADRIDEFYIHEDELTGAITAPVLGDKITRADSSIWNIISTIYEKSGWWRCMIESDVRLTP